MPNTKYWVKVMLYVVMGFLATRLVMGQKITTDVGAQNVGPSAYAAGGGIAQAQTVTLPYPVVALVSGLSVCWLPTAANSGAGPTLAVNGLTAKTITKLGATALVANDLTTAAIACAVYDGTEFQLQNPQVSGAGPTLPLTSTNGGTGAALNAAAAHSTIIGNGGSPAVFAAKVVADCQDTGGQHTNFTQSTDAWSCGTSTGSAAASAYPTVTDGAPISWNLGSAVVTNGIVTLVNTTATRALNISNPVNGGFYTLVVKQDGTGGALLTLGTGCTWKVANGGAGLVVLTAAANAIDILAFTYDGTNCYADLQDNFN